MTEPLARANRARRAVLSAEVAADLSGAARSVLAAVPGWWARRAGDVGLTGRWADVALAIDDASGCPPVPPAALPRLDLVDASPERLGDAYVCALDQQVRTSFGRHYTPPDLAGALYDRAREVLGDDDARGLIYDPACGAGALLLPALRAWLGAMGEARPEFVLSAAPAAVAGRDLDRAAVWLGNVLLAAELLPLLAQIPAERRRPLPALLTVADGLTPLSMAPRTLLMNPPYGRVRLGEDDRRRWAHVLHGHANRYGLFLAAAADQVAEGGVVAALVPAGWLGGAYFQRLRSHLAAVAPARSLAYVNGRSDVFTTGVLQETVLVTFAVGGRPGPIGCERVTAGAGAEVTREAIGLVDPPSRPELPWVLPRRPEDVALVQTAGRLRHRLADFGWRASTGPLVWNRHKPWLGPTRTAGALPVVWASDLASGMLRPDQARDALRWARPRDDDERRTLLLDRPAVLVARTTAPEQPRRLLAASLGPEELRAWGGAVVVENHVNVLSCADKSSPLTPSILLALLASWTVDRLYRCLTGSVAVSAFELAALPLPSPETMRAWADYDSDQLTTAIDEVYGVHS